MTITDLKYPRLKRSTSLLSCAAALSLSLLGCGDEGGNEEDVDTSTTEEDMSPATSGDDKGEGDGNDVITIGDSWMSLGPAAGIQVSIEKISGRDYRNYGVGGTRLLDEVIPKQYAAAKAANPDIKTVIMTGGGNDILQDLTVHFACIDSAFDNSMTCKKRIDEVGARLVKLWAEMAEDGVEDVIMIGYSNKAGVIGPLTKTSAYSALTVPPLCAMVPAPLRCHAFDSDAEVPDLKLRDGIHPDDAGYDAIATELWQYMQDEGIRR
jgi:lysophospholipase L1-like esterase